MDEPGSDKTSDSDGLVAAMTLVNLRNLGLGGLGPGGLGAAKGKGKAIDRQEWLEGRRQLHRSRSRSRSPKNRSGTARQ